MSMRDIKRSSKGKKAGVNSPGRSPAKRDDDSKLKELVPRGLARSFVNAKMHDKAIGIAGLGAPLDWEDDMPQLPNDIATVDHDQLSNLLAQFVNAYSTAIWQASKAYVEADAYEEIADYLRDTALLDANESNEPKRKAAANIDDAVVMASAMWKDAYRRYVRFRDLAKTLDARMKAVSRIGGFVSDEAEGEDLRAGKSSSRGKSLGSDKGRGRGSGKARSRR